MYLNKSFSVQIEKKNCTIEDHNSISIDDCQKQEVKKKLEDLQQQIGTLLNAIDGVEYDEY